MVLPLVALCHFCELHGPRVVFTTEVRCSPDSDVTDDHQAAAATPRAETCPGCTSVEPSSGGFCTQDADVADRWFCSQQLPADGEQVTLLRQACSRSLSCEVCPGPDGVMYFGDDVRGHVVSYNFTLRDVYARGLQRRYSIVILSSDKHSLLNNWCFFCQQLKQIGADLQANADRVFDAEEPLVMEDFPALVNRSRRRSSQSIKPTRSLSEITDSPLVYPSLHQLFTFLLRSGENRTVRQRGGLMQSLASKPPLLPPPVTANPDCKLVSRLCQLRRDLGPASFSDVVSHVVVGHQLVVRGRENDVTSVIEAFRLLLPPGCFSPVPYSSTYQLPHRCNLLGVAMTTQLPAQLPKSVIVIRLADVGQPERATLESMTSRPGATPSLVGEVEAALGSARLPEAVLEHRLSTIRLNWKSKSELLYDFWSGGGGEGGRSQSQTESLLTALGCRLADLPLLQFWMTGN